MAALWRGLALGQVDILATDHAPHTVDQQSAANVWEATSGFIGVETMLPLMLTEVANGRLSLERLVYVASYKPAAIWKIGDRKGHLGIGADADFNLVDPVAEGAVRADQLHSRHPVSPYDGWRTRGAVRATYLRGRLIAKDGEPIGDPAGALVTSIAHRRADAGTSRP